MRNPRVYTARVYIYMYVLSNSRSRIRSPSDSRWDIRSAAAFFSCSYSARVALLLLLAIFPLSICPLPLALSTHCSDKTFLNWVSSEGDVCPASLEAQPASLLRLFIDFCFSRVRQSFWETFVIVKIRFPSVSLLNLIYLCTYLF